MKTHYKTAGWLAMILLSLASLPARADGPAHPVVLELFTSQGCSSCPPADKILAGLADRPNVLALSWHITYWNNLGWADPLSFEGSTSRQNGYATAMGANQVYTPQMIVQGGKDVAGSDAPGIDSAIADSGTNGLWIPVSVTRDGKKLHIRAEATTTLNTELLLIGYLGHSQNKVPSGENAGTMAEHRNSVVSIQPLGNWDGAPLDLSADVPQGDGYAVLVQSTNYGPIIGGAWGSTR
jgi:hypothetical protein